MDSLLFVLFMNKIVHSSCFLYCNDLKIFGPSFSLLQKILTVSYFGCLKISISLPRNTQKLRFSKKHYTEYLKMNEITLPFVKLLTGHYCFLSPMEHSCQLHIIKMLQGPFLMRNIPFGVSINRKKIIYFIHIPSFKIWVLLLTSFDPVP